MITKEYAGENEAFHILRKTWYSKSRCVTTMQSDLIYFAARCASRNLLNIKVLPIIYICYSNITYLRNTKLFQWQIIFNGKGLGQHCVHHSSRSVSSSSGGGSSNSSSGSNRKRRKVKDETLLRRLHAQCNGLQLQLLLDTAIIITIT